jgi:Ca2+-binding EF-hand superfamily protein
MAAISRVETLFAKERLEKAFEFIDRDGTGEIEISELI